MASLGAYDVYGARDPLCSDELKMLKRDAGDLSNHRTSPGASPSDSAVGADHRRDRFERWSGSVNAVLARNLIAAAIAKAEATYGRPICVAVCDQYGFLTAFAAMDDAPVRSIQLSQGKAYTSARMGVDTDAFLERLRVNDIPASHFCDDKLTGLPGGCVVKDAGGRVIGAVGISGLTPDEDLAIAKTLSTLASAANT